MNPTLRQLRIALLCALPIALMTTPLATFSGGVILCPIKLYFGVDCPGCGMTRAFAAVMQLDFAAAFHYNPRVVIVFPILAWSAARQLLGDLRAVFVR